MHRTIFMWCITTKKLNLRSEFKIYTAPHSEKLTSKTTLSPQSINHSIKITYGTNPNCATSRLPINVGGTHELNLQIRSKEDSKRLMCVTYIGAWTFPVVIEFILGIKVQNTKVTRQGHISLHNLTHTACPEISNQELKRMVHCSNPGRMYCSKTACYYHTAFLFYIPYLCRDRSWQGKAGPTLNTVRYHCAHICSHRLHRAKLWRKLKPI